MKTFLVAALALTGVLANAQSWQNHDRNRHDNGRHNGQWNQRWRHDRDRDGRDDRVERRNLQTRISRLNREIAETRRNRRINSRVRDQRIRSLQAQIWNLRREYGRLG